jgi:HSP20 family protein
MNNNNYKSIFRQMEREMQQLTDEVFRGFFETPMRSGRFWQPQMDIHENGDQIHIKVELAGVNPNDIAVSLSSDDRQLTISGVRKEGELEREGRLSCHQLEIYFGPFERTVQIPSSNKVDREKVRAAYKEGFLLITLPKIPVEEKEATRIPIISADEQAIESTESRVLND